MKEYNEQCIETNNLIINHKNEVVHKFTLKEARMINFNYAKGFNLELKRKRLCENEGNFLRIGHKNN